jgi:radical SAM superfamily enzyme YgiQ (UPF0313 family)
MATPILLCTLNARYSHAAFGLRYVYANLGELQASAKILEFTINQDPREIAETILAEDPRIVGLGVYIWNSRQSLELVSILKRLRPGLKLVLGGPEVSYEAESQAICQLADLTIQGEGDLLFAQVCRDYLGSGTPVQDESQGPSQSHNEGQAQISIESPIPSSGPGPTPSTGRWPNERFLSAPLPDISELKLPYSLYTDSDIQNRVLYVEASRGCPYKCEYCLSSLDKSVRSFDLDRFLGEMQSLIDRGARQFKFIDRTFNLSISTSSRILRFFLDRMCQITDKTAQPGLFLHFEMVPDRLPEELRELIRQFPKGALQFEIGIQTWNPQVARLVSRRQNYERIRENFAFLAETGNVHTHADLIVGLPGETLESFAQGFDAVCALKPDEIQVGLLKRLKGTPIIRHDAEWAMVYQEHPPFQVLSTKTMSFADIQRMGRFSRYWDLIANSGNFKTTLSLIEELAHQRESKSLFWEFDRLCAYLNQRHGQSHGIALLSLTESVWSYLRAQPELAEDRVRSALVHDYAEVVRRDVPNFLRMNGSSSAKTSENSALVPAQAGFVTPKRQRRHLGVSEQST